MAIKDVRYKKFLLHPNLGILNRLLFKSIELILKLRGEPRVSTLMQNKFIVFIGEC